MKKKKGIGIKVKQPKTKCSDRHCPFHGELKVRGRIFSGVIIKKDTNKSVTIEFPRLVFLQKYERYEKKRSRIRAHNPPCINAEVGDSVRIVESKPISKSKHFVIIENESS